MFPRGLTDRVLQVLASVSRQATVDEIRTWNVTTIDTLSTLMDKNNGVWDQDKVCVCLLDCTVCVDIKTLK